MRILKSKVLCRCRVTLVVELHRSALVSSIAGLSKRRYLGGWSSSHHRDDMARCVKQLESQGEWPDEEPTALSDSALSDTDALADNAVVPTLALFSYRCTSRRRVAGTVAHARDSMYATAAVILNPKTTVFPGLHFVDFSLP